MRFSTVTENSTTKISKSKIKKINSIFILFHRTNTVCLIIYFYLIFRTKRSIVWNFFKKVTRANRKSTCLNCEIVVETANNITNCFDHLKRFHPHLLKTKDKETSTKTSDSDKDNGTNKKSLF